MLLLLSFLLSFLHCVAGTLLEVKEADLRFDIALIRNSSSNAVDFHISIDSHFKPKGGWVALGTGHGMRGALMFIMYSFDGKGIVFQNIFPSIDCY